MKTRAVFLFLLSPRGTPFVEDTAPTRVIVRQPRESQEGGQSTAANHQCHPCCPLPWSLRRHGQKRLQGLTIATPAAKHHAGNHGITASWCPLPSPQRGKVRSQNLGISRVLLGGPRVEMLRDLEPWDLSEYNVQLQGTL